MNPADRLPAGPSQVVSEWNQPWAVGDPMLMMIVVNVCDLKTTKVLSIPGEDPLFLAR